MNKCYFLITLLLLAFAIVQKAAAQPANPETYLSDIKAELDKKWPKNRTINLVFHGHSVPTGYFATPKVNTLEAYPHALLCRLKEVYPFAVVNVITTSIGGENSEQGQKRMKREVLNHRPDVLFIDYALNDRGIGLAKAGVSMEKMIREALRKRIKVILLTPSPDISTDILKEDNALAVHSQQLIYLSDKYHIGLADSFGKFKDMTKSGMNLKKYMAQSNHPNEKGHQIIADLLMKFFKDP